MDSDRLGSLMDRLAAALELYARQWCDAPEDVVQDAFVKLATQTRPPLNPTAWLFRTVRNGAINAGIAGTRRKRHETAAASAAVSWFEEGASTPYGAMHIDPDSAQAALASLPGDQREVIVAHVWGGLTFEQVAELAGISTSTAHRLYHTGLIAMRERLGVSCRSNTTRPKPN
jgi:RNA polymerase sigma-70 factor (ECF subfamily)